MARKDLLKGLTGNTAPDAPTATPIRRTQGGAIGVVSRSIDDLRRRAVVEVDPRMIDAAGLKDRLDPTDADLQGLIASIQEHGQQVPVMLRVNPNDPERYQVVYGRRRVAALIALGQPIKALIRDLNDRDLIVAQGQENTARKDLSFIEKANFARQMRDAGYDRKTICAALSMDKTLVSRLMGVADQVDVSLIEAIGSAPSVGRDRWLALANQLDPKDKGRGLVEAALGTSSDARFAAVLQAVESSGRRPAAGAQSSFDTLQEVAIRSSEGRALGKAQYKNGKATLQLKISSDFTTWLAAELPNLLDRWESEKNDNTVER